MTTSRWLLACAGCLVAGAAAGAHFSRQPDTIATETATERVEEGVKEEATAEVQAETTTQASGAAKVEATTDRVRIVYRERAPDGGSRELEVEADSSRLALELQASRDESATLRAELAEARSQVRVEVREVERRVEVRDPLPDWRVGGLVGVDLRGPGLAYGAELQRRILGPVYMGAGYLSTGVPFIQGGFEFP